MQGYPRNILKGRMAFGDDRNNHPPNAIFNMRLL